MRKIQVRVLGGAVAWALLLAALPQCSSSDASKDDCSQGCQHLQDCGLCIQDQAGGCLNVQSCASTCATYPTGQSLARCVSSAGCDTAAISACVGPSTSGGGSQCAGCYWDGSACTWCSTSNWGSGPYSGACSSCDATCCPGH